MEVRLPISDAELVDKVIERLYQRMGLPTNYKVSPEQFQDMVKLILIVRETIHVLKEIELSGWDVK